MASHHPGATPAPDPQSGPIDPGHLAGKHWAIIATLIQSAKLNDVDPLAWLTDVLERIVTVRTIRTLFNTSGRRRTWCSKGGVNASSHC
jgi:hypothetical protein